MLTVPDDLRQRLRQYGQEHVLAGWDRLTDDEQPRLLEQLRGLDLAQLQTLYANRDHSFAVPPAERIQPVPVISGRGGRPRPGAAARRRCARRGGGAAGGGRPGEPARLRPSQGDVRRRPGVEQDAVSDPRREGAGPAAPPRQAAALPGDDQPGDRRRDARLLRGAQQLRPAGGRGGLLLPGDDAGARPGDRPAAAGGARAGCSSARTVTAAR